MGLRIGETDLDSRLLVGSARFPSPQVLRDALTASGAGVVTVSLRRQDPARQGGRSFWDQLRELPLRVLPNTAGCRTVREAVTTARMAREIFQTSWIKLELVGDEYTLQPDPLALVEAAAELVREGFEVLPYATEDLVVARRLVDAGCRVVMPWASPIGSGQGLLNSYLLRTLRERLPDITLIVDAGLRSPSEAAAVMELGFDGVLVNSAIALAQDPVGMARAFAGAVVAGRQAHEAGLMPRRDTASPSTPVVGTPFWHQAPPPSGLPAS